MVSGKFKFGEPKAPCPLNAFPQEGKKPLGLGFFVHACFDKFHNDRYQGDANDEKDDQTEVVLHKGQVSKKVSRGDEQAGPDEAPQDIVKEKSGILHFAGTGHKGGIGAYNGNKSGDHNGLPPIFGKKGLGLFQIAHLKKLCVLRKYFQAHIRAYRIIHEIPQYRGNKEQGKEDKRIQGPGGTNGACREQEGIPRQKRGDHKAGFRKDDQEENEVGPQPIGGYYAYKVLVNMDDKIDDKL